MLLGHRVKALTRRASTPEKAKAFEGAEVVIAKDTMDSDTLVEMLQGVDTLICTVPGFKEVITESEPIWLNSAKKAGVKGFVPTEFGDHTRA